VDLDDWWHLFGKTQSSLLLQSAATSSEAVLATLPIALFFHEDSIKLRQQLQQAAAIWQHQPETLDGVLAVAYAIALALTEKLDCTTLIPRILDYLGTSDTPVVHQLTQVHTLLQQGVGLNTTLTQLRREVQSRGEPLGRSDISIALAFYCFLTTPEEFRLCVSRAARIRHHPQITTAITGALAGVYNSLAGIPVSWRLAINRLNNGILMQEAADHLLESWAGVYNVSESAQSQRLAVAAPHVIQPR
jgi:ADP-ribosylglycohydrolase